MSDSSREYDLVVFGANGYTGRYTAEHVTTHLPTDLKWAVAGRSTFKLEALISDLKALNPDRAPPSIEVAELSKASLHALAAKTRVLISTVGPYSKYGTGVVEACAANGTHYLDVTAESPWVYEMIRAYDGIAKKNHAIMIPQIGIESAPADLLTWSLATHARRTLNAGLGEVVYSLHDLKGAPSGGTLASVLGLFEQYSLGQVAESTKPWSMCPVPPPAQDRQPHKKTLFEKLLGVREVSGLGVLTTSIQGTPDSTIVHRSWGLLGGGEYYGERFQFSPYMRARNVFTGVLMHVSLIVGVLALLLPPVRWLLRNFVYQPGQGTGREIASRDRIEYRAIATTDSTDPVDPKKISGRLAWDGSLYYLTGVFLAEAAITLLRDESLAKKIGGGFLTPATLGGSFVERLQKAGLKVDVRVMP